MVCCMHSKYGTCWGRGCRRCAARGHSASATDCCILLRVLLCWCAACHHSSPILFVCLWELLDEGCGTWLHLPLQVFLSHRLVELSAGGAPGSGAFCCATEPWAICFSSRRCW